MAAMAAVDAAEAAAAAMLRGANARAKARDLRLSAKLSLERRPQGRDKQQTAEARGANVV